MLDLREPSFKTKNIHFENLTMPRTVETFWAFWKSSLLQNIKKEGHLKTSEKNRKKGQSQKIERDPLVSSDFANARISFWLQQGLEPVSAGFALNRITSVPKSGTYRVGSGLTK